MASPIRAMLTGMYHCCNLSPDGKFILRFYCSIHPEYADYFISVKTKGKRGQKHLFFYKGFIVADMFFMFFFIREWKSDYEFELKSYSEEIIFYFNVESMQQELRIIPSENSLEYCQNMLSAFDAGVSFQENGKRLGFR